MKFWTAWCLPVWFAGVSLAALGCEDTGRVGKTARPSPSATLNLRGSDTMVALAQRWAERFMHAHPEVELQISGGGSGTGIAALVNGTTDLASASRPMTDRELEALRKARGVDGREYKVAIDTLAVYVHSERSIASISLADLKRVYRGNIASWAGLGGPDEPIVLYSRENSSGTYAYFKEHVLDKEDFAEVTQLLPGTAAVINAVTKDRYGIGYGGVSFGTGVRMVPLIGDDGVAVAPTLENAVGGRYPLSRYLYLYTAGTPTDLQSEFIQYVLSDAGQALVHEAGYFPLPKSP